ncbi:MAG: cytidine/deoxycytidylate deaminase family protein [Candidatus Omnitrophica bacterium]|nr:cytidine/deoxycytidylate deaminase family protein [Candidatus Omnitrophota bacterium]
MDTKTKVKKASTARPSWDEYFVEIAHLVSKRSTCLRRKVGAVIVKEKRILATGYNGAPRDLPHCDETGCLREQLKIKSGERHELCRGLHGEQNALLQASLHGVSVKDSVLYCTNQPCIICAKMLINAGIKGIVITSGYPDKMSMEFLDKAGVKVKTCKK